jgi:hypothetical protein
MFDPGDQWQCMLFLYLPPTIIGNLENPISQHYPPMRPLNKLQKSYEALQTELPTLEPGEDAQLVSLVALLNQGSQDIDQTILDQTPTRVLIHSIFRYMETYDFSHEDTPPSPVSTTPQKIVHAKLLLLSLCLVSRRQLHESDAVADAAQRTFIIKNLLAGRGKLFVTYLMFNTMVQDSKESLFLPVQSEPRSESLVPRYKNAVSWPRYCESSHNENTRSQARCMHYLLYTPTANVLTASQVRIRDSMICKLTGKIKAQRPVAVEVPPHLRALLKSTGTVTSLQVAHAIPWNPRNKVFLKFATNLNNLVLLNHFHSMPQWLNRYSV